MFNSKRLRALNDNSVFSTIIATLVIAALSIIFTLVTSARTKSVLDNIIEDPIFLEKVTNNIDNNIVSSANSAYFSMGKKNDPKEYSIPIYVSENQKVELYVKAIHYIGAEKTLAKIDIYVGGSSIEKFKINSKNEYQKGMDITTNVREAMDNSPYDFSRNIQRIVFRLDPEVKTENYVLIEALVKTIGVSKSGSAGDKNG